MLSASIDTLIRSEYEFKLELGLLDHFKEQFEALALSKRKAIVLVDQMVHKHHEAYISQRICRQFDQVLYRVIPSGESSKSFEIYTRLVNEILNDGIDRHTPLIAIGGGVTGDLSGFIAASCLRGIPLIHLPTTTLAMVDSSIGGKVGINTIAGKNLVGSFYQPKSVLADLSFLKTLPKREFYSGLVETLKHAIIRDKELLDNTLSYLQKPSSDVLERLLFTSAQVKINIVKQDVQEKGVRAHLNLGHTFGHAIEAKMGYGNILHGEAVFLGLIAAEYAASKFYDRKYDNYLEGYLIYFKEYLPSTIPASEQLLPFMLKDKKNNEGNVHLLLSKRVGEAELVAVDNHRLIYESLDFVRNMMNKVKA
jgi:3-dehydroquinate synthase